MHCCILSIEWLLTLQIATETRTRKKRKVVIVFCHVVFLLEPVCTNRVLLVVFLSLQTWRVLIYQKEVSVQLF